MAAAGKYEKQNHQCTGFYSPRRTLYRRLHPRREPPVFFRRQCLIAGSIPSEGRRKRSTTFENGSLRHILGLMPLPRPSSHWQLAASSHSESGWHERPPAQSRRGPGLLSESGSVCSALPMRGAAIWHWLLDGQCEAPAQKAAPERALMPGRPTRSRAQGQRPFGQS